MASSPGLALAEGFYVEAVRPIVERVCPGLRHSAVRIGQGSEVLGYDDGVSQDHDWGPRLELFVDPSDADRHGERLADALVEDLPPTFRGYSTSFAPDADGVGVLVETEPGTLVTHRVEIHDVGGWCQLMLGFDPRRAVTWFDWLATPSHRLAEVTGGAVFHDGLGELGRLRSHLAYYPTDVWLFILASQWKRIAQEEAFVARCAQVGDALGSTVIVGRLVRDLMRLCLVMERRYIPYAKWLGSAFTRLAVAEVLGPHLLGALHATDARERQDQLGTAYKVVADRHNALGVTPPIEPKLRPFWNRVPRDLRRPIRHRPPGSDPRRRPPRAATHRLRRPVPRQHRRPRPRTESPRRCRKPASAWPLTSSSRAPRQRYPEPGATDTMRARRDTRGRPVSLDCRVAQGLVRTERCARRSPATSGVDGCSPDSL